MKAYHLNYAAVGQLSRFAARAMTASIAQLATADFYPSAYPSLGSAREQAKREIAHLLGNVSPSCLAFAASTSDAFGSLLQALPLNASLGIAVGRSTFVSLRAALSCLEAKGVPVYQVGDHRGCVKPEDLDRLPCSRIGLVVVDWVNWLSGYRNDIQALAAQCRETNIPLVVDAVQGVGAAEINFNLDQIGALVCGGHKWLCGPEGTGFCYVSPWLIQMLDPSLLGYRSLLNPIDDTEGRISPRTDAAILEVGTQNTVGLIGLGASLKRLRNNAYSQRVARIKVAVADILADLSSVSGVDLLTPTNPLLNAGIVTFRLKGVESRTLLKHFASYGIHCGVRQGWVRLSPGPDARSKSFRRLFRSAINTIPNTTTP